MRERVTLMRFTSHVKPSACVRAVFRYCGIWNYIPHHAFVEMTSTGCYRGLLHYYGRITFTRILKLKTHLLCPDWLLCRPVVEGFVFLVNRLNRYQYDGNLQPKRGGTQGCVPVLQSLPHIFFPSDCCALRSVLHVTHIFALVGEGFRPRSFLLIL